MKSTNRALMFIVSSVMLVFQAGCLTPSDVQSVAQGQLISFINALINTVTSDAIRGALGG
ncbi:MAG: hypothetical protein J5J06_16180 [Phycisphaerae bacterium]|nr:hypothetical protein [Phycisphaerae bacterium]